MSNPSVYQKILALVHKVHSKDVGKALIITSTAGWVLSAIAQVYMVATNDKIDKKQKKFLIPQEIADGVVNVGLYYTICKVIKNYADKLVEKGQISLDKTERILSKFRNDNQTRSNWVEGIVEKYVESVRDDKLIDITEKNDILKRQKQYRTLFYEKTIEKMEIFSKMSSQELAIMKKNIRPRSQKRLFDIMCDKELLELMKQSQKEFAGFKNGVGVIAAIGASVLASNIVTPVCRNLVANKFQDKHIRKVTPKPVYHTPISSTFVSFNI